jgi:phage anti-repressor protein
MEFQRLDIVQLINNSPLVSLSNEFQTKLLSKIQESFTDNQQQLFVASFYSYLNYNSKNDFVINLDEVWKWCGFARIDPAKRVLEKHFTENVDYKTFAPPNCGANFVSQVGEAKETRGGHNKEQILMNIETFKTLCMLAGTSKSKEIRQYYIKLEELMQQTLQEESEQLKKQLQEKDKLLEELENKPETEGFSSREAGEVYCIKDTTKPGHLKIGFVNAFKF